MKNSSYIPHLITVIFFGTLLIIFTSWIGSIYEWPVQNILSPEGIRWILRHIDENFYQAPFIPIFILLIGVGLTYNSGLLEVLLQRMQCINHHKSLSKKQKRAILLSLISGMIYLILIGVATFSPWAILLGVTGTLDRSPFIEGIIPLISIAFIIFGIVYGIASGRFHNDRDIIQGMSSLLVKNVNYFILLLVGSQFFSILHYSQIDKYIGIGENELTILQFLFYYLPLIYAFIKNKNLFYK